MLDVERDARLRLPLRVELQQLAGHLAQVLARPRLQVVPRLAAELRQRRRPRVGADVAADLADLLVRHVHAVVAAVGEQQVVARDARDLLGLEAEQLRDAVVLVHDVVAGAQVGEALQRAAGRGGRARRPLAEDLRVGKQREAELAPDEAAARRRDGEREPVGAPPPARGCSRRRRGAAAPAGGAPRRGAGTRRRRRAPAEAARSSSFSASERPRAASAGRCASKLNGWPCGSGVSVGRAVERDRRETLLLPGRLHLVGRPDDVRRTVERRHEVVGRRRRRARRPRRAEVDLDQLAPTLAGRIDRRAVDRAERALRERRERADLLDLVAEELDAERLAPGRREDVDEPAADGELAALLDALDALVARRGEVLGERVEARARRRLRTRSGAGRAARGGRPSAIAAADAQTRPPCSSTSSARARSPTRCGGGSRPLPQCTPRDGNSATRSSPANHPAASAASRASASSGRSDDQPAIELLVQRREQQRQHRLGDARARRQRSCELLQALLCAEALDECVEYRPVHDVWPNCTFGGGVMVIAGRQTRRRAPSNRAEYQPESGAITTRVPVCGAWMKRPPPT